MTAIFSRAIFVLLLAFVIACPGGYARSVAGMPIDSAKQEDFFRFFRFKETERHEASKDESMAMFETQTGGYTVQLAVVVATRGEAVKAMTMILPRKFVDDAKYGLFARDIAKSFLLAGVPDADANSIKLLVNEISFGGQDTWKATTVKEAKNESTGQVTKNATLTKPGTGELKKGDIAWIGGGAVPKLPAEPSPGYKAYLGKETVFEKKLSGCRIRINNTVTDGQKYVMFNVWVPGTE